MNPLGELAVITVHFNPCGFTRPVRNYQIFRDNLNRDVYQHSVELAFNGKAYFDATCTIQGDERNLLWQKESLINRAVSQLPDHIKYIAWLDHDIVFQNTEWATSAIEMFESGYDIIQPFSKVTYLDKQDAPERSLRSVVANKVVNGGKGPAAPGMACMATRWAFNECGGLPYRNILGAGDVVAMTGFMGIDGTGYANTDNPALTRCNHKWRDHARTLNLTCGFVPGEIHHLYHGTRESRQYNTRLQGLKDYHPYRDVRLNSRGVLEWTGANPELQEWARNYFMNRKEDT